MIYPTAYFIDPYKLTKSLAERLAGEKNLPSFAFVSYGLYVLVISELNVKDPILDDPVDIGLPVPHLSPEDTNKRLLQIRKEHGPDLERAARLRKRTLDLAVLLLNSSFLCYNFQCESTWTLLNARRGRIRRLVLLCFVVWRNITKSSNICFTQPPILIQLFS